jgi:hypothetical protein
MEQYLRAGKIMSKLQRLALTLIPVVAFLCQDNQIASAREYKQKCREIVIGKLERPTGRTYTETYTVPGIYPDGRDARQETRIVNETKLVNQTRTQCLGESTISAATGFNEEGTSFGISYRHRASSSFSGRMSYLLKDKSPEIVVAVTREIELGYSTDLFVGLGMDFNARKRENSLFDADFFVTTGIDYQLFDRVDLNANVRIPIGNPGSTPSYLVGLGFNF